MPEGRNGCAHAANYIAAYYDPWSKKQIEKGGRHMSNVPQLVEDARQADGPGVIDFDETKLRKGNMIVYKDPKDPEGMNHVVVYMGNGPGDYRYVGNSSDANGGAGGIIDNGQDYREMSGMHPQYIIKTGGNAGTGGHTVNAHDSGYEDRMIRRLEAARSDWMRRKKDEATNRLQGYQSQIQNAGSAANALSILERIKNSEQDPNVYSAAIQTARTYYPDAFKVSNNITGSRRGDSSGSAKKYWDGKSGKRYTNAQKEEAEKMVDIYNNDPNALKYNTQEAYDRAARIMNDIWATNYNDNVLAVVQGVWSENKGDWYSTVSKLQEKYGMNANEAGDYVNYWLRLQNDSDE